MTCTGITKEEMEILRWNGSLFKSTGWIVQWVGISDCGAGGSESDPSPWFPREESACVALDKLNNPIVEQDNGKPILCVVYLKKNLERVALS